jgi:hypothetical protein
VANGKAGTLTQVNAGDGSLSAIISVPDDSTSDALLFADGHIWAGTTGHGDSAIPEYNPDGTLAVDTYGGLSATSLAFDGSYIWAADGTTISQVDASSTTTSESYVRRLDPEQFGLNSSAVAFANGRIWSANGDLNTLTELPPPSPGE